MAVRPEAYVNDSAWPDAYVAVALAPLTADPFQDKVPPSLYNVLVTSYLEKPSDTNGLQYGKPKNFDQYMESIKPFKKNMLFEYSEDGKKITISAEGKAFYDTYKAAQFTSRVAEHLKDLKSKTISLSQIKDIFTAKKGFGKDAGEIAGFQKWLDKNKLLNVDGKKMKSINPLDLADHFTRYMAEKYPIFYETISR